MQENLVIRNKLKEWSNDNSIENVLERTIILHMVPSSFNTEICRNFLNGLFLTILGDQSEDLTPNKYIENIVEINSNDYESNEETSMLTDHKAFRVTFTSMITTQLCLMIDNIPMGSYPHKIICKRPKEYVDTSVDIFSKFTLPNISEHDNNREMVYTGKCIISNLPSDINENYLRSELEYFGKLKYLKILHDPTTGVPGGTGFFEFEESNLSRKVISTLNGKKIGSTKGIWNIRREFATINLNSHKIQDNIEYVNASDLNSSISYKLFKNPIIYLAMKYSKIVGETPSKVVKLNNIFLPEEVMDDEFFNSTLDSVKSEAETYGTIIEITSPRPKNINEYYSCGGGKIFIYFSDITSARRAQYQFNGRVFDNTKTVSATFYPIGKYLDNEYNLISFF